MRHGKMALYFLFSRQFLNYHLSFVYTYSKFRQCLLKFTVKTNNLEYTRIAAAKT